MFSVARLSAAATLVLFSANEVRAQQSPATPDGPPIIVLGTGLPLPPGTPAYGSVEIDRQRLDNAASGRLEDALLDVAGFQQFRRSDSRSANPTAQGATLRALGGNASSRTLVLLDGVPLADPFFGYIPFTAVTPDRLAGVRVTRGGGSGPFGAGAVAGIIELASATRAQLPLFSASAFAGSHDAREVTASITPDVGNGFVSLSGRWERGDGFHTTPRDQRVPTTARARYRDWSADLRAVTPIDDRTELQARATIFRDNRTLRFRGADSSTEGQDASVRIVHRGEWQVDALAYLQTRNFRNLVIIASGAKTLDQRDTPSTGIGGKIEVRPPVGDNHVLRLGVDVRLNDGRLSEESFNPGTGALTFRREAGGRSITTGAFVEDDWTLDRLTLTGGARIDRWAIRRGFFDERSAAGVPTANSADFDNRTGTRASFRAGALFAANDAISLRAAAYSGFRLPTLNELYRRFVVSGITTQANAELDLERLKGVEAGVDITPLPGVSLGATIFYNRLNGAIANVTLGPTIRQRQNVRAIVARGFELSAEAQLDDFTLTASYAHADSKVRAPGNAFHDFIPAQSPRHSAAATISWSPAERTSASLTVRHVGRQYEDDLQNDVLPAATVVDAFASLPVTRNIALVARAENLFDKEVVTRNAGGSIDLGTPRTLWIGVKIGG